MSDGINLGQFVHKGEIGSLHNRNVQKLYPLNAPRNVQIVPRFRKIGASFFFKVKSAPNGSFN